MKITDSYLTHPELFAAASIKIPSFDDAVMAEKTATAPRWVHFGGGNLYRCFHAKVAQDLLNSGDLESGIIVVETFGQQLIKDVYQKFNNRSLTVVMKADGSFERELIASTGKACYIHRDNQTDVPVLENAFKNDSLQLVTLTITEKGYGTTDSSGNLLPVVAADIAAGPDFSKLQTTIAQLAYFTYLRYQANQTPLALVSTDNFSHNGQRLKDAINKVVSGWLEAGHVEQGFYTYLFESGKVSYPNSMIDRITPGPNAEIAAELGQAGIEEMALTEAVAGPPLAAFVNTEEVHYLAIEDNFPNGRPALEKATGVFLADGDTVNKADLMKVTTCLNPLHTALAITGSLLGYTRIYDEVQNKDLLALIEKIGYKEGLPVVEDPQIINPKEFIDEVIYKRFMNPNIPDTPQRIASDTSQKLAIRFGETIRSYVAAPDLAVTDLTFIPYVLAAWCRYLMGVDDQGQAFTPSPDPLLAELQAHVAGIELGSEVDAHQHLAPILSNKEIFGVDLYAVGLGATVENLFSKMIAGPNKVIETLQDLLEKETN